MRKGYNELHSLNQDLLNGYHVRSTNHEELVKSMKLVNQLIQKASHLRGKIVLMSQKEKINAMGSILGQGGPNYFNNKITLFTFC